jgi:hypothetical protein
MKYTAVLPFIYQPYKDEFEKTCKLDVMYVDNTVNNLGIMKSHNLGIDKMIEEDADWLIILSAAIRFGEPGGLDFIKELENSKGYINVPAVGVFGWHLIAFSRECIEKCGKWDENFTPYGWDDIDYSIRMQKGFPDPIYSRLTKRVFIDVKDTTMAHSINLAGVKTDNEKHINYMKNKWNYDVGADQSIDKLYDHPFNDETKSVKYWPGGKDE